MIPNNKKIYRHLTYEILGSISSRMNLIKNVTYLLKHLNIIFFNIDIYIIIEFISDFVIMIYLLSYFMWLLVLNFMMFYIININTTSITYEIPRSRPTAELISLKMCLPNMLLQ